MKKINYGGSIASDVELLKKGTKAPRRLLGASALSTIAAFGLLPVFGGVASAAALGVGAMFLLTSGIRYCIDAKRAENAEERLYSLLDAMHVDDEINENDIRVFDVHMSVQNLKKFETRLGKYIIVRDKGAQHIIREHESVSDDYADYQQFLVDYESEIERQLVLNELSTSHDVVILKK